MSEKYVLGTHSYGNLLEQGKNRFTSLGFPSSFQTYTKNGGRSNFDKMILPNKALSRDIKLVLEDLLYGMNTKKNLT